MYGDADGRRRVLGPSLGRRWTPNERLASFPLQFAANVTRVQRYVTQRVSFDSDGSAISGVLYRPRATPRRYTHVWSWPMAFPEPWSGSFRTSPRDLLTAVS